MKIQLSLSLLNISVSVSFLTKFVRYEEGHFQLLSLDLFEAIRADDVTPWLIRSRASVANLEVYHLEVMPTTP